MKSYAAGITKIGINPYVHVPENVLNALFKQASETRDPNPVRGTINGNRFKQTIVKYQAAWQRGSRLGIKLTSKLNLIMYRALKRNHKS